MILQSTEELEARVNNKYRLVIVAAKRACQLKARREPGSQVALPHPLTIALREIHDGEISYQDPIEEEIVPAPRDMITELVTGTEFDLMEEDDQDDRDAVDELAALLQGATDDDSEVEEQAGVGDEDPKDETDDADDSTDDDEEDASDVEDEGSADEEL